MPNIERHLTEREVRILLVRSYRMTPQDVDWWLQTAQTLVKFDDETRQYIILYVVSRNTTLGGARQLRPW